MYSELKTLISEVGRADERRSCIMGSDPLFLELHEYEGRKLDLQVQHEPIFLKCIFRVPQLKKSDNQWRHIHPQYQ